MAHNNTPPGFPTTFYATHVMETVQQALTESKAAIERLVAERRVLQADVARYHAEAERLRQAILRRGWWREAGSPCAICGYDGAGYYQPETHVCAAHAAALDEAALDEATPD